MTEFENNEEAIEYLSDSTINSLLGNTHYSDSDDSEDEDYEDDEDISFSDSEDEDESISEIISETEEDNYERENPENVEEREMLEMYKKTINSIIDETVVNNKELENLNVLNQDSIKTLYYYENNYKENYDFKSYALRIIFTKIILLKFKNRIDIKNITNLHITLDPLEIMIEGLNIEETKLMKDFFIMYLESK